MAVPLRVVPWALVLGGLACAPDPTPITGDHLDETRTPATPAQPGDAAKPSLDLADLVKAVEAKGGALTACVLDVETGAVVAEHASHTPLNPASNQKVLTAALALDKLGADHRFVSGLYGELRDGNVETLTVRGNFDPTLDASALRSLIHNARLKGLRTVGSIVVDQAGFSGPFTPPAFEQQPNEWAAFRAPIAPTSYERNTVTLFVTAGADEKKSATVVVHPAGFVTLSGGVTTSPEGDPERLGLTLEAKGQTLEGRLGGSIPVGAGPVPVSKRVEDPSLLAGYALKALLAEQGITTKGDISVSSGKKRGPSLAVRSSEPLGTILANLGKDSDNFTAEMLFLAAGAPKDGAPSVDASRKAAEKLLAARGVPTEEWTIVNGSGLFQGNKASAHALASLLRAEVRSQKSSPEFLAHFGIAGVDGTMKNRMRPLAEAHSVRAKTGTLADTVALSGVVMGVDGNPRFTFAFVTSGVKGRTSQARDAIDRVVLSLARSTP